MTVREVTIRVPLPVYEQVRRAAASTNRSVDEVLVEAVIAAAPAAGGGPGQLRSALAHMAYLNDAALWQAARATMTAEQRERLEALHDKQQAEALTAEEHREEQALLDLYRGTVLIRAQAAALLKQRGYDITDPAQFAALE